MNHYRTRDHITTMDVIIIAALAVAVMVALATCGQAADGLTLYEQTELKTYTLPNIGPSQTGMVINFDDSGQGFWYCLDPYDAVKWKAHNPPQWEQPTAVNISVGEWELLPLEPCPRMAIDASGSTYYINYTNPIGYDVIETTSGLLSDKDIANLQIESDEWAERVALKYETITVLNHSLEFLELQREQNKILDELFDTSLGKDKKREKSSKRVLSINSELSKRIKDLIKKLKGEYHEQK